MAAIGYAPFTSVTPFLFEKQCIAELPGYSTTCFSDGVTWSVWLDRSTQGASASEYTANLRKIYSISSMQVLLTVCENIVPVRDLNVRYSYHFMLGSRRPVWEDDDNKNGGMWTFRCTKPDTERVWRTLLEALVMGKFDQCIEKSDKLVGFSVGVREVEDVVHIWNVNATKAKEATLIDRVITLLPKITFKKVIYKAFCCSITADGKMNQEPVKVDKALAQKESSKIMAKKNKKKVPTISSTSGSGDFVRQENEQFSSNLPVAVMVKTPPAPKQIVSSVSPPACPSFPSGLAMLSVWSQQHKPQPQQQPAISQNPIKMKLSPVTNLKTTNQRKPLSSDRHNY